MDLPIVLKGIIFEYLPFKRNVSSMIFSLGQKEDVFNLSILEEDSDGINLTFDEKYLTKNDCKDRIIKIFNCFAKDGRVDLLEYMLSEYGIYPPPMTIDKSANLKTMTWIHRIYKNLDKFNSGPFTKNIYDNWKKYGGRLEPFGYHTFKNAIEKKDTLGMKECLSMIKYIQDNIFHGIIYSSLQYIQMGANLEILKVLKTHTSERNHNIWDIAICSNDVDFLETEYQQINLHNKIEIAEKIIQTSINIRGGNLNSLKWFCEKYNVNIKKEMYVSAAKVGNIEILSWLKETEFKKGRSIHWNEDVCLATVKDMHYRKSVCDPWTKTPNKLATLKWLRNNEIHGESVCPWNIDKLLLEAAKFNNKPILDWLKTQGITEPTGDHYGSERGKFIMNKYTSQVKERSKYRGRNRSFKNRNWLKNKKKYWIGKSNV